jgi:hypothetical protein
MLSRQQIAASTLSSSRSCGIDWHKSSGGELIAASFCCACASISGE